jgi:hypothetical protein
MADDLPCAIHDQVLAGVDGIFPGRLAQGGIQPPSWGSAVKKADSATEAVLRHYDGHVVAPVPGRNRQHVSGFRPGDPPLGNVGSEFADVFGHDVGKDHLPVPEHLEKGGREL